MRAWETAASWAEDGLARETFYFSGGAEDLYASLYVAAPRTARIGVVVCPGWPVEEKASASLGRALALRAARLGGAGLVFHYPGAGDSFGDLASGTVAGLVAAAVAAVRAAKQRAPEAKWVLAGFSIGAAVAALAAEEAGPSRLLLVQPALEPRAFFEELVGGARRWRLGEPGDDDVVYGHPLPRWVRDGGPPQESAPRALDTHAGGGAIVRYTDPPRPGAPFPDRFEERVVVGPFRRGEKTYPELEGAACAWLEREAERSGPLGDTTPPAAAPRAGRGPDGTCEHPVLVETEAGVLGGIVTEPSLPVRADLLLVQGAGDARAGLNAHWARTVRALAELGVRSLRADFAGEGESHLATARHRREGVLPFRELTDWFRARTGDEPLLVLGSCFGARAAVQLAAWRDDVDALGLVVPPLKAHRRGMNLVLDDMLGLSSRARLLGSKLDVGTVTAIAGLLARMPVWMLTGERDTEEPELLRQQLLRQGRELDLEVVSGIRIYPYSTLQAQNAAQERVVAWADRVLAARAAPLAATPAR